NRKKGETIMKPFNLEEAKAGKPVCTRNGNPAKIIDFDCNIVIDGKIETFLRVFSTNGEKEATLLCRRDNGYVYLGRSRQIGEKNYCDLMMGNRFVGWQNIVDDGHGNRVGSCIWKTREEAEKNKPLHCVSTIKIFWEEEDEN
ncbi:MAG: hypothetical protein IIW86_01360, partial [Clostridia bacterium]|nr:hypothetical protein [Clostridia bacterium]